MPQDPQFDVFLSHSSKDKAVVRELAERLRGDGLRVWFDEPGGNSPANIERGLENSRVLVLCMSANAFGSDWAQLESQTFRFRDALNKDRRFIPLRLDNAPVKDSLDQFLYIDWRPEVREREYAKLFEACRSGMERNELVVAPVHLRSSGISLDHEEMVLSVAWSPDDQYVLSGSKDYTMQLSEISTGRCLRVFEGHTNEVNDVAWSPNGELALSGGDDRTVRLWEINTGRCLRVFKGHRNWIWSVAWSPDGQHALSSSEDQSLRLWEISSSRCLRVFKGHSDGVVSVAWSPDGQQALSAARDQKLRLWDIATGRCQFIFNGHSDGVMSVAWSAGGQLALSGSEDETVRLWDVGSGRCLRVFEGHTDSVMSVVWSPDGRRALSGSNDHTVRLWDIASGRCLRVLHGHRHNVWSVAWSSHGDRALSASLDGEIRIWEMNVPIPTPAQVEQQIQYTNAKVLLVAVVFNPQNENPFESLGHWDNDLAKTARRSLAKLLVAGRVDRGGLVVSSASIQKFIDERGFRPPLHLTSAKTGEGCEFLRQAIVEAVDWQSIPETTSPALYHRMKQEIINLRDKGHVLMRLAELKQHMDLALAGESYELDELETVVGLLSGPGMIKRLDFGGFILLRPEVLSRYAAAVVRKVRKHPQELGCIREEDFLAGDLDYQDFERLPREDEAVVLRALLETFVKRAWCLRQIVDGSVILTFPSYFRRERKEQPSHPSVLVTYRFDGPTDEIYATLVVRLHHTLAFESKEFWRSAADFTTQSGGVELGFTLFRETEGTSRLEVYFQPTIDENSKLLFLRYIHDHLTQHAQNVIRLRHYFCATKTCKRFNKPYADQEMIDEELADDGEGKVHCPGCGKPIRLRDDIEKKFASPALKEQARETEIEVQIAIDNESRELILVGHAYSIVAEAGQIYRGYTNSDHGIDGEIEFKDDQGHATGKKLYVQLKSGDSYLKKRKRDDREVFPIKNARWTDYWQQHAYTVMLVVRTSDGEIRWMDVSTYLKRETETGKEVKQIVFEGERFDVMSVRRWREKLLR